MSCQGGRAWLEEAGNQGMPLEGATLTLALSIALCFLEQLFSARCYTISALEPAKHGLNLQINLYSLSCGCQVSCPNDRKVINSLLKTQCPARDIAQHLTGKHEAMSLIPSIKKTPKNRQCLVSGSAMKSVASILNNWQCQ